MKAPIHGPCRQASPRGSCVAAFVHAPEGSTGDPCHVGHCRSGRGFRNCSCRPFPSQRSGPSQTGPASFRRSAADCSPKVKNCFEIRVIAIDSAAITTTHRGSLPCASRLSFLLFSPHRWPVACRTPLRAGWRGPLPGLSSPMQPRATSLPARSSAALRAPHPAGSNWACRPAARPTELTAFGRLKSITRAIRAHRPGGPSSFVPQGGADV